MQTLNYNKILTIESILLVSVIFFTAPFFTTTLFLGQQFYYPVVAFIQIALLGLFLLKYFNYPNNNYIPTFYFFIFLLALILYITVGIAHAVMGFQSEMLRFTLGLAYKFFLVFILLTNMRGNPNLFIKNFLLAVTIMSLFSIIVSIALALNIWPFGYSLIEYSETKTVYNFYISSSSSVRDYGGVVIPRIAGWLDEPGSFALVLTFSIIINEITLKNKNYRTIYFIAGFFSFSLAFYISSILFLFYYLWIKKNYTPIFLVLILIAILVSLQNYLRSVLPFLFSMIDLTFSRFNFDSSSGTFVGDNRFAGTNITSNILFGEGLLGGRDSVIGEINNNGLIGLIAGYIPIFTAFWLSLSNKEIRPYSFLLLIIFANYMQRPALEKIFLLLLTFSIIFIFRNKKYIKYD